MIELLQRADPAALAVVTHDRQVTYAELLSAARRVATGLRERGIVRFAILESEAETVLALLAGASLAGVEACQYAPAEPDAVPELRTRFDHDVVVGVDLDAAELLAYDEAPLDVPERRPHLVLTTGTTGAPKGIRHDWSRLLRGVARVRPDGQGQRWLLAYGMHQFAGLQVLLHVAAAGATLVAPWPRRPVEGLRAARELGVTHASATPTYWRFLLSEMRADGGPVPALRQITLGGEAAPGPVLAQLHETFPDTAISHIYAASEFGSSGSTKDGRPGLPSEVLTRGEDADIAMKVVDGELWVRSRTGMLGYYGEPELEDPDGWRATGDLVEVDGDRVVFHGRASEVINVGGVKVHPLPVEERVGAVPGVAVARVWGRPNPMTGAIVAIDLVVDPDADADQVKQAVRDACADLPAAARPRSVRIVPEISLKGSKIVRQAQ